MSSCKKCKPPLSSGVVLCSECYEKMEAEVEQLQGEVERLQAEVAGLKADNEKLRQQVESRSETKFKDGKKL